MKKKNGTLIISLDFELFWGVQDCLTMENYQDNVLGGRIAILKMLELFKKYNIHATWATVGFIFASNKDEVRQYMPAKNKLPQYDNKILSTYNCLEWIGDNEAEAPCFFAESLINEIKKAANQEIASHTYSHYYCQEKGQTLSNFDADLKSAKQIANSKGIDLRTLVLPRNQCRDDYISAISTLGFVAYRGEEKDWIHTKIKNKIIMRGFRLLDSYLPLTGHSCYCKQDVTQQKPFNLRGSRFLRPYNHKLAFLECLKILRIKRQMLVAAKQDLIFHLWWHPHNFGINTEIMLNQLENILKYYNDLHKKYGMTSMNMKEVAEELAW